MALWAFVSGRPAPQPLFDPFSAPDAGAGCRFAANTAEYRMAHPHAKSAAGASTDHIKPLVDVQLRATVGILRQQLKQSGTGLAELALGALPERVQLVVVARVGPPLVRRVLRHRAAFGGTRRNGAVRSRLHSPTDSLSRGEPP